jgi:hypothetical protein
MRIETFFRIPSRFAFSGRSRRLLTVLLVFTSLVLTACGGGGGSGSGGGADSGTVVIGLTDTDGDFATYTVDVSTLALTRRDGAEVEVLPARTRVDFAQYTDLTEFLTAAAVPTGIYTDVRMTLDFSQADIRAAKGDGLVPLIPVDAGGGALSTLAVDVRLDGNKPLTVAPGLPAHLTLDFDLQATNTVDLDAGTVTVLPLLVAEVNAEAPKPHRVRGPLLSVDAADGSFVVSIRPFHLEAGDFGRLRVATDAQTLFEIDGQSYQGEAGLAALAAKPTFTATVAIGELQLPGRGFRATQVMAGSSVAFGGSDAVSGSVTARSGNTLTVRGATLVRADRALLFNDDVTVVLDASTRVTRELDPGNAHTIDDISVGQYLTALGTLSGGPGGYTLATGGGLARLQVSAVAGHVAQKDAAPMTLEVQSINGRPVSIYDFSGTAADPQNYRIATGTLSLATLESGEPVRVRGFVQPFNGGVMHDFDALSVIDLSAVSSWLAVRWNPASAEAFSSLSGNALVLNLAGSDVHHIGQEGVFTDLTTLPGSPVVAPPGDGKGVFAILVDGSVQAYGNFTTFEAALADQLAAHSARGVLARGSWDGTATTLTGRFAVVNLP